MSRKYVKIDEYGKQILEMKAQEKTNREIAQTLGVDRKCIRNWITRFNRQQHKLEAGIRPRPKRRPHKDTQPRDIVAKQESCKKTYGYRRMKLWLDSEGIVKNPKTILRIMHKYDLLSEIRHRMKWRRMGEDKHKYDNWLNREFNAEHPNQKWVTDISYIHTGEGVLYLSMIRDLYDRSIVAYKTSDSQTVSLVLDTIHLAMKSVKVAGSCTSTATKGSNTPHKHIST